MKRFDLSGVTRKLQLRPPVDSPSDARSAGVAPWRRGVAVVLICAAVGASFAIDSNTATTVAPLKPPPSNAGATSQASSTAWYCPMVFANNQDPQTGTVMVLNTTDAPITATMAIAPSGGQTVDVPLNIPALSRVPVNPGNVVNATFAGVTVRADGGGLAVEQNNTDRNGSSWTPCGVEASTSWQFANASTDNAGTQLALYNPFDEYAIADIVSATNAGRAEPVEYQGVVIPARGLVTLEMSDQLRRREWISTSVDVRRGKLVVDQMVGGTLQGVASPDPASSTVNGLSTSLGSEVSTNWVLPDVVGTATRSDRIAVYNPSTEEAELELEVRPDRGDPVTLDMYVPSRGRFVSEVPLEARLPEGVGASVRVRSTNGVPVALTRTTTSENNEARGFALSNAISRTAQRWAIPSANTTPGDGRIWIVNDEDKEVTVELTIVGNGSQSKTTRTVGPKSRQLIRMADIPESASRAITLEASAPIAVSREYANANPAVMSISPAVPLR